uniref:UBX domain-containing protein n=1 Tax=Oryza punctata TaxID=4537 RepID=A0A0E0K2W2_ORYPU
MALLIVRQTFLRVHSSLHVSPAVMETRVAVVTGGNRGVGLEICRQLASNGIIVVLTARDEKKGSQAVKALEQSGVSGVIFHHLDVTDRSSIMLLVEFIRTKFGKFNILVNNAAIGGTAIDPERLRELLEQDPKASFQEDLIGFVNSYMGSLHQNYEMAKECLETNFYGTKDVTDCLMPLLLLSNSGKVINLSSKISQLQFISNEGVIKVLSDIDNLSYEKLKDVPSIFLKDFKDGNLEAHGWQPVVSAYAVSKTLVNAYSRLLAKRHPLLEVCCVNPGFVKTDMNYGIGLISAEEGAKAPEAAVHHLASCRWDLDAALNRYFIFGGVVSAAAPPPAPAPVADVAPPSALDDGVRAPIPARSDTLYGDMYGGARRRDARLAPSVWEEQPPELTPSVAPEYIQMPSAKPAVAPVHIQMPSETTASVPAAPVPVHAPSQPPVVAIQPTGWEPDGDDDDKKEQNEKDEEEDNGRDDEGYGYSDSDYGMDMDDDDDGYGYDECIEKTPSPPPKKTQQPATTLAEMFRRPHELMHDADFHSTKVHAARQDRWLLLNLQSAGEFTSQMHNRDLWADEVIAQVVRENFVFSLLENRYGEDDDEASKVCCFYKLHDQQPAVLVIDPITGQMLAKWSGVIQPEAFLVNIEQYTKSKPSMHSKPYIFQRKPMPVRSAPAAGEQHQEPAMADTTAPMDTHNVQEPDTAAAPAPAPVEERGVQQPATAHAGECKTQQPADDQDDDQPLEGEKMYRMRVRFPDGSVVTKEFGCKRRVAALFNYCRSVLQDKPHGFKIKSLVGVGGAFHELPQGDKSFEDLGLNCATVSELSTMGPGSNNSFPAEKRVAVVTGGNRGLGLEICKQLAANGVTVVLTARSEKSGAGASVALRQLGLSEVMFHQFDVTEPSSAACLADFIKHKFGKLDILFFSGEKLKEELNDFSKLSEERMDELAELFVRGFKDGELETGGWPARADAFVAYKTSKALQHAYTRVLARKHASSPLRVNCVHPGYIKTDMTLGTGELTVEEGAAGPVALALSPPGGATGMFFIGTEPASFV